MRAERADAEALAGFALREAGEGDRFFDYCLEPYRPRRPVEGKLRADNLLLYALDLAGIGAPARRVLEALRAALGRDMVVWGVKHDGERLFFELYVYDPRKEEPAATVAGLTEALRDVLPIRVPVRETVPYMMVSFDLDDAVLARGEVNRLDLYLTGSRAHEGRSYHVDAERVELANTYRFFTAKPEIDAALELLTSSAFIDYTDEKTLARVIPPELFACKKICVAKKRDRDGVYFSGIEVDQLLWFLKRFTYPEALVAFASACAPRLDHVYFDVGIDLAQDPDGTIRYPKTSFYGTV